VINEFNTIGIDAHFMIGVLIIIITLLAWDYMDS